MLGPDEFDDDDFDWLGDESEEDAAAENGTAKDAGKKSVSAEGDEPRRKRRRKRRKKSVASAGPAPAASTGPAPAASRDSAPAAAAPPADEPEPKPRPQRRSEAEPERRPERPGRIRPAKPVEPEVRDAAMEEEAAAPASHEPARREPARRESRREPPRREPARREPAAREPAAREPAAREPAAEKKPERKSEASPESKAERPPRREGARDRAAPRTERPARAPETLTDPRLLAEPLVTDEPTVVEIKRPPRLKDVKGGFNDMGLSETMLDALHAVAYLDPTPVQEGLIPRAMAGVDVMGQARTGTGKTAAFAIPILDGIERRQHGEPAQALILVPTRELAVQVRDECSKLAAGRDLNVVAVYGGKPIRQQAEQLRRGAELLIGTPGRVIDLMNRGILMLGELRYVVLDEADRMLDIGFRPDIEKILRRCPASRQTLLLSATIPPPVKRLAERYMRDPEMLDFSTGDVAVETIEQFYFSVDPERKFDLLVKLLQREQPSQAIVFCRTRRGADRNYRRLEPTFQHVDAIHGDLAQSARDRVMKRFREGKTRVLVATDVVGRGIDVSSISHIINFDIPQFSDDYVHRVGRTGRMGREGVAYTFVSPEEGNELTRIEMRINRLLKRDEIPGFSALEKPLPTADFDETTGEAIEPAPVKPVFGRHSRKHRRAL